MISIIIPVFNEEEKIVENMFYIQNVCAADLLEIIVVDGGSSDRTVAAAKKAGAFVVESEKGRSKQMNYGASIAKGDLLYFLHADSVPPNHFDSQILDAYQNGAKSGCFRLAFDYKHWFLKANSWFTRFDINAVRFGDQSLFVSKEVFDKCGGFRTDLLLMEDQEIIHRIKKYGKFVVINDFVTTSARKYVDNGIYKVQGIFFRIWALYYLGYAQERLLKIYKKLIPKHVNLNK